MTREVLDLIKKDYLQIQSLIKKVGEQLLNYQSVNNFLNPEENESEVKNLINLIEFE